MKKIYVLPFLLLFFLYGINSIGAENSNFAFTDAEKKEITAAHNKTRTNVGISVKLVWDESIAKYAQEWANYLSKNNAGNMKHRPRSGEYKQKYGENLYWASAVMWSNGKVDAQNITPTAVENSWASEKKDYNYNANTCAAGKQCGHYTQIVWKNSTKVGCGKAINADKSQLWVCNYNPPGNYVGEKPY